MKYYSYLIPWFPISVIAFLVTVLVGSSWGIIPSINDIVDWSYYLYRTLGLPALFISATLESIAYVGLYFPSIIILTVIISNGTIGEYVAIASVTALAIVLGSTISYYCGYHGIINSKVDLQSEKTDYTNWKLFVLSNWHPNVIGLWFFKRGVCKQSLTPWIFYVWPIMFCWGFFLCFTVYALREQAQDAGMTTIFFGLFIWLVIDIYCKYQNKQTSQD